MSISRCLIALLLALSLSACASAPPRFRAEALATLQRMQKIEAEATAFFPAEFASTVEAFNSAEALLKQGEGEDAEQYYQLTLLKGAVLEREVAAEQARRQEAARQAEAAKQAELARQAREEAQRQAQAKAQAEAEALAQKEAADAERRKTRPQKERLLVSSYTVRRGESLPLIASQPEVYSDRNLWPLIYRANRDQIRDPRHLWPGQVLRIPRHLGRDDIAEARRYAQERPLH